MKHVFFLVLILSQLACYNTQAQNWAWAKTPALSKSSIIRNIIADKNGNCYVAGQFFTDSIIIGNTTLYKKGAPDVFVSKFDPSGNAIWSFGFGGNDCDEPFIFDFDSSGNLLLAGDFTSDSIVFSNKVLYNNGGSDIFIIKFSPNGNLIWETKIGSNDYDHPKGLVVAPNNDFYLTGVYSGDSLQFGSNTLVNASTTMSEPFIVKFSNAANPISAFGMHGAQHDLLYNIVMDKSNNYYVMGITHSDTFTCSIGPTIYNASPTECNLFIWKFSPADQLVWSKNIVGKGLTLGSLSIDAQDNITAGFNAYTDTLSINNQIFTNNIPNPNQIILLRLDTNGNFNWANSFNTNSSNFMQSHKLDNNGDIYLGGYLGLDTLRIGSFNLTRKGMLDIFYSKINSNGIVEWANAIGGNKNEFFGDFTTPRKGGSYYAGGFSSANISMANYSLSNAGSYNSFLARLGAPTALQLLASNLACSLFPNPFSNQLTITFNSAQFNSSIVITDIFGHKILEKKCRGKLETIDCTSINPGAYIISVIDKNNNVTFCSKIYKVN